MGIASLLHWGDERAEEESRVTRVVNDKTAGITDSLKLTVLHAPTSPLSETGTSSAGVFETS